MSLPAALITGAASGIGKALAVELGKGHAITVVDRDDEGARRVAAQIVAAGGQAIAVRCDVTNAAQHAHAFQAHMQRWGRLDVAVLNAGIGERGDLVWGEGSTAWQATLDIDLRAVAEGVRLAVRSMTGGRRTVKCGGAILVTASAGGLFPMPEAPVYSASKAGCVQLVRALAPSLLRRHGIGIAALCPQFTDTELVRGMQRESASKAARVMADAQGSGDRLLTPAQVADAGLALLADPAAHAGVALVVLVDGSWAEPVPPRLRRVDKMSLAARPAGAGGAAGADATLRDWAASAIPASARSIEVHALSTDFRAATHIVTHALPTPLPPGTVLVRRLHAAVNASDINFTAGRYFGGASAARERLPFPAGFEALGVVAACSAGVTSVAPGHPVATMTYGGFADWAVVPAKHVLPVPRASPEVLVLLTSGLTASIALEQCGRLHRGEKVLVTAAAGGTGHIAVQLAKLAGCHVVATCSGGDKAALLRRLGADRVISYQEESVKEVLKREYASGIDVVYESVGGEMLETAVNALAVKGRLIVIGAMSQYKDGWQRSSVVGLPEKLLWKSATMAGFFLNHYTSLWKRHLATLAALWQAGKLQVELDPKCFVGLEAVPDAVDWLQSGRSMGKVCVQLAVDLPPGLAVGPHARL